MKTRRAVIIALMAVGVLGVAGIAAELLMNPLRRSRAEIRDWVLAKTPLGASREQVLAVIDKEGWRGHPEFRGVLPEHPLRGTSFYGADLGSYQDLPFRCRADAFWCFDASDRMIDLYVSSWCEGM